MQCYILTMQSKIFALETKKPNAIKLSFLNNTSVPCLLAFENKQKTCDVRLTLEKYSFKDIAELNYNYLNYEVSSDNAYKIFSNVYLSGYLIKEKNNIEDVHVELMSPDKLAYIDSLIITQGLNIFIPKKFEIGPQTDKFLINYNFLGVLLQPTFYNIEAEYHAELMIHHLKSLLKN
jgi:hypothetical protein